MMTLRNILIFGFHIFLDCCFLRLFKKYLILVPVTVAGTSVGYLDGRTVSSVVAIVVFKVVPDVASFIDAVV